MPDRLSLTPLDRGTAFALIEVGSVAFFAAGVAARVAGPIAPWFVLGAVLAGAALRALDLEGCALFVPGALYGLAKYALGRRAARVAASTLLVGHVLLVALAASAAGHAVAAAAGFLPSLPESPQQITMNDLSTTVAVCLVGAVWLWLRQGRLISSRLVIRTVGIAAAALVVIVVVGLIAAASRAAGGSPIALPWTGTSVSLLAAVSAIGSCAFAAGSPDTLAHAASEFGQPKIYHLRRAARIVTLYSLIAIVGVAFIVVWLVPAADRARWYDAPVVGVVLYTGYPEWLAILLVAGVAAVSVAFLGLAIYRTAGNAQQLLLRLSEDGSLGAAMRVLHPRFGTPYRLIDLVAILQLAVIVVGAGQLVWLARALAVVIGCGAVLKTAALLRLRRIRPEPRAFRVPGNLRLAGREWPVGLASIGLVVCAPAALLMLTGDPAAIAGAGGLIACTALLAASERASRTSAVTDASIHELDLLTTPVVGADRVHVRPGNVLVAVRRPGVLAHLAAALQAAGDREVVVMTVRLVGVDVSDELATQADATDDERRLLTGVAMLAERHGRAVRLVIVPATNVFDAVAETASRLRSAEVYVGESETLAADDQARLLGDAWERAPKPQLVDVRLVIHHSSGRTAVYHLGAHAPSLSTDDFQLIHALWLDVVKAVGSRVHHHDVVRAALKHMEEQLHNEGPPRDAVLAVVRQIARPADELAAAVHDRDFARLRDMVRNRPPSDLAAVFTDLTIGDQVVTFRVLPRKVAAAIFEYLSHDSQTALLKAMAQEDVASLLNNMAPDDRTMFLEELPASATQQLLALLKPEERTVAITLLGYPENSIGRLMTPDYIAVREQRTVQEVLDHIRAHGQDSETLNVIYVVDDHGLLIDDIRIRELLLASPASPVSQLMDRRFVALNAADDQKTAVTIFRREDRSALPVTDSTGVLIGIVTIDDVLDVAEAAATTEIQRIGGSEALDEPYMRIAFTRMIQKRAGWLTALFLGEMLTATAMGAFEREIERAVVLALFVPLIISSGGNSGSQASTLVIRAIALGEVQLRDWWQVIRREIFAGLALGAILGSIGFLRITLWSAFSTLYGPHWLLVALTVGIALVGVVVWGTLIGSLLPFILRRLGFDPAASSAPFVATLVDVTGLIIYFSVGLVTLRGTLL
jgi:magnesium transporter